MLVGSHQLVVRQEGRGFSGLIRDLPATQGGTDNKGNTHYTSGPVRPMDKCLNIHFIGTVITVTVNITTEVLFIFLFYWWMVQVWIGCCSGCLGEWAWSRRKLWVKLSPSLSVFQCEYQIGLWQPSAHNRSDKSLCLHLHKYFFTYFIFHRKTPNFLFSHWTYAFTTVLHYFSCISSGEK